MGACNMHDDLWLGAVLASHGIARLAHPLGVGGVAAAIKSAVDNTTLKPANRENLLTCNVALLSRWPNLWHPRPRLIGITKGGDLDQMVTGCVGHIDHWYQVLALNATATSLVRSIATTHAYGYQVFSNVP